MNKILFDLNKYDLTVKDFNLLINKNINNKSIVNGYKIEWDYNIKNGVVELTALLVRS